MAAAETGVKTAVTPPIRGSDLPPTCPPERDSFNWTPFAKTGDPDDVNASANPPRWPVYDAATDGYLELEATDHE